MKVLAINRLVCVNVEALADALIDNELSVETNLLVLPHLSRCHDCKAMMQEKTRIKQMLRVCVRRIVAPGRLVRVVRAGIAKNITSKPHRLKPVPPLNKC